MARLKFYKKYYDTYLRKRSELENQGYTLYPKMSYKEYKEHYITSKSMGMVNIARDTARAEIPFDKKQARKYIKELKKEGLLGKRFRVESDEGVFIGNLKISNVEDILGMTSHKRKIFFDYLHQALGMSYEVARDIYYG